MGGLAAEVPRIVNSLTSNRSRLLNSTSTAPNSFRCFNPGTTGSEQGVSPPLYFFILLRYFTDSIPRAVITDTCGVGEERVGARGPRPEVGTTG